ncbi:MAG: glycoside hydrolase family 32 protein [bacterium]|nr:glycoside hydrolase family 32 protein [bacterium]
MTHNQGPTLHLTAPFGAMNDPNGMWIDSDGRVHVVYQHNPAGGSCLSAGTGSGPKHWGHAWSDDLIAWTHGGSVIAPTPSWHDCDGAWSGSIVVDAKQIQAFYTGVRFRGDGWSESVCSATIEGAATNGGFEGDAKRLLIPASAAGDGNQFRDPYVTVEEDGTVIMIVGGGTAQGGRLMAYASSDLVSWESCGLFFDASRGSSLLPRDLCEAVWECPQLVWFDDVAVLIFSIDRTPRPVVYLVGSASLESGFCAEQWGFVDNSFGSYATHIARLEDEGPCSIGWIRGPSLSERRAMDPGHLTLIHRLELDSQQGLVSRFARSPSQVALVVGMEPRRFEGGFRFSGMNTALIEANFGLNHASADEGFADFQIGSPEECLGLRIDLRRHQATLRTPNHEMTLNVRASEVELDVVWDAPIVEIIVGGKSLTYHFMPNQNGMTLSLEVPPGIRASGTIAINPEHRSRPHGADKN